MAEQKQNLTRLTGCIKVEGRDALHGWKEIASYVGIGVRTAQRWEHWGFPVRRPRMGTRANVVAIPQEIRTWLQAAPVNLIDEVTRLKTRIAQLELELNSLRPARTNEPQTSVHQSEGQISVLSN